MANADAGENYFYYHYCFSWHATLFGTALGGVKQPLPPPLPSIIISIRQLAKRQRRHGHTDGRYVVVGGGGRSKVLSSSQCPIKHGNLLSLILCASQSVCPGGV